MIIADVGLGMILGSVTLLGWQMRVIDATSTVGIQPYKSVLLHVLGLLWVSTGCGI